jgi:hypothetical protein
MLAEHADHYELRGPLVPLLIPATLQDSLMARLDRLASVKAVAQLGATLGREFPYELLRATSLLDDATLHRALEQLVDAELIYQRGVLPHATYVFKHALVQDAAINGAEEQPAAIPSANCTDIEARFPAIQTPGPRSWLTTTRKPASRRRRSLVAMRGAARRSTGARGGDQPPRKRIGNRRDAVRYTSA